MATAATPSPASSPAPASQPPRPPPLGEQHKAFLPLFKAELASRPQKWGTGIFLPFPSLPKDTAIHIFSFVGVKDLCTMRRVSRLMERYMSQLQLRLRVPRFFNSFQTHVCVLMFPSTRIISFDLLPKMNVDAWRFLFSVLQSPVFDLKNITYDVLLDKAGRDLFTLGHYQQALQCFNRGLEISTGDEVLIHNRGVCLFELKEYHEALICFEASLKANPGDNRTKSRHALCMAKLGKTVEGMAEYDAVLKSAPDALTFARRGALLHELGKNKEALEDYAKCADELKDPVVYRERAAVLEALGDKAAAAAQIALAEKAESDRQSAVPK